MRQRLNIHGQTSNIMHTCLRMFQLAALASLTCLAQPILLNQDFAQGQPGNQPPGWKLGHRPGSYTAKISAGSECDSGKRCVVLRGLSSGPKVGLALLFQNVNGLPYRGKTFRYRAAVRVETTGDSKAGGRLLVRVHRSSGQSGFFDNMEDRAITSGKWAFYEIAGTVDLDAVDIEIGIQLAGSGAVWFDSVSTEFSQTAKQ